MDGLLAAMDAQADGTVSFDNFCRARMRARVSDLADKAARRVDDMHAGAP